MAGIIIILVLYTLTINYNWIRETVDLEQLSNFEEKSENYNKESRKVVTLAVYDAPEYCVTDPNKAITDVNCPAGALFDFSNRFVDYAQQSDPNYGLIYVYKMPDGSVIVKNMLGGWLGDQAEKPQTLKIEASRNFGAEKVPIDGDVLLSTQDTTTGTIDLNIGGMHYQTSVKTKVSNFGQGFSQAVVKGADKIIIKTSSFGDIEIPLQNSNLWNGQTTFTTSPKGSNADVRVNKV